MCDVHINWGPNQAGNFVAIIARFSLSVLIYTWLFKYICLRSEFIERKKNSMGGAHVMASLIMDVRMRDGQDVVPWKEVCGHQVCLRSLHPTPGKLRAKPQTQAPSFKREFKSFLKFAYDLNNPTILWFFSLNIAIYLYVRCEAITCVGRSIYSLNLDFGKSKNIPTPFPGGNEVLLL